MLQSYEIMLLAATSGPSDEKSVKEQIKKHIDTETKVESVTEYGKRTLAYPIRKQKDAHYWVVTVSATGAGITTLSKKMRQDDTILRFLVLKKDE